ncbi:MAG: ribosomal RNA small subunit methyltransferase A [Ignavibacteriales bacterium CG07_land_8_20_14_0_80_59_12]|nr:MAG: ribosomal RNA small subunit methyltransferase A [Ignavibacteriales bacterium CG07_land_8_20_14_0_80_59_12]
MSSSPNQHVTPRKGLGQHFLVDTAIARRIVAAIHAHGDETVVEIGPGRGALTRFLLESYRKVIAIEIDGRAIAYLREKYSDECREGRLVLLHEDVRDVRFDSLRRETGARLHVAGNLPYYLSGLILSALLDARQDVADATVMLQREVAQRLTAEPRTKAYGILSVLFQGLGMSEFLFKVPPRAFHPPPNVYSGVVRLQFPKESPIAIADARTFLTVVKTLFGKRRKMLRNTVAELTADEETAGELFRTLSIDPRRRPEELSVADFAAIANYLTQLQRNP